MSGIEDRAWGSSPLALRGFDALEGPPRVLARVFGRSGSHCQHYIEHTPPTRDRVAIVLVGTELLPILPREPSSAIRLRSLPHRFARVPILASDTLRTRRRAPGFRTSRDPFDPSRTRMIHIQAHTLPTWPAATKSGFKGVERPTGELCAALYDPTAARTSVPPLPVVPSAQSRPL